MAYPLGVIALPVRLVLIKVLEDDLVLSRPFSTDLCCDHVAEVKQCVLGLGEAKGYLQSR